MTRTKKTSKTTLATTTPARRIGARRMADVPPEILKQLNRGEIETASLTEMLAMDLRVLLRTVDASAARTVGDALAPGIGITQRMRTAGETLLATRGEGVIPTLASHPSDIVRGWAAYAINARPRKGLKNLLTAIRPLADDPNSGVREWAWLAVRPRIAAEIDETIVLLTSWTGDTSPYIRRFATEATRPRGVWCCHIDALKTEPERALPLLNPLHADGHKYVQDSVANWLNDAGKTRPDWVRGVCARWLKSSGTPQTRRICTRAQRRL
jgi:3-methyladenine DNA glycosylase AlkC